MNDKQSKITGKKWKKNKRVWKEENITKQELESFYFVMANWYTTKTEEKKMLDVFITFWSLLYTYIKKTILSPFDMWYINWEAADISVNPFCEKVSLYNSDSLPN